MRTNLVTGCLSKLVDIWRTVADRCGQLWLLGVSLSWRTFDGQVRTGADRLQTTLVTGCLSKLADRCGQVRTILVTGCLSKLVDIWRTGADNSGYWVSL